MNVSDAIRTKRAVRKFQEKPLTEETIRAILNAGRRSQSSKNNQDWRFIAITDKAVLKELSQCGEWAGHIAGAALAVAILTPDPSEKFQYLFDAGQSAAFMQLAAWELGRLIGNRRDSAIYGGGWQRGDNLLNRERGAGKGVRCWIIRSSGVSGL